MSSISRTSPRPDEMAEKIAAGSHDRNGAGTAPGLVDRADVCEINCPSCGAATRLNAEHGSACGRCGRRVTADGGVTILDAEGVATDYPEAIFDWLPSVERQHFWFANRQQVIVRALRRHLGALNHRRVLDVGCGSGTVMEAVEAAGAVVCGVDMHVQGLRYARSRTHGPLVASKSIRGRFPRQFDAVLLCDVIEHLDDPIPLLRDASDVLVPNGIVLITVPASPRLWSPIDDASGHKRRYTRPLLSSTLADAGLTNATVRGFALSLLPGQAARVWWSRRHSGDAAATMLKTSLAVPPPALNQFFGAVLHLERRIWPGNPPWGTSLLAVATFRLTG